MLNSIIQFSIHNKLIVGLLIVALIGWGTYEVTQLPIDAVPDITNNQVQVLTVAPSQSALDIERLVTFPVEQTMATIPGIVEIRSFSRFGLSVVTIVFSDRTDVYWARQQVGERLVEAKKQIPPGVGIPELAPVTTGLGEIYQYILKVKPGYESKYSIMDLRTFQDWIVRRQLIGTKGVADVSSFGGYLKQYEIALSPEKLRSLNLSVNEVFTALEMNNQNTGGAYIEKNSSAYFIRSEGLLESIEDINNIIVRTHQELDLLNQKEVDEFFNKERPEYVFHFAAKVGGVVGNKTYPADFNYENTQISLNVIHSAHNYKVKKLLNLGSVCIYPVNAPTPIKESYLLSGPLEVTNEAYAISKINSLMLCKKYCEQYHDNFISAMPANIYGENDNYDASNAHVIPMLMKRIYEAKLKNLNNVTIWGTGKPTRDFIYVKDLASALFFLMENYDDPSHINVSTGVETSIQELATTLSKLIGFEGDLYFDTSKPDGTPKRYMDIEKINSLGWKSQYDLEAGLKNTLDWFIENYDNLRAK